MGWGHIVLRISGLQDSNRAQSSAAAWIGLTCVMAMTQVAHLFLPINWQLSVSILVPGLIFWVAQTLSNRAELIPTRKKIYTWISEHPLLALLVGLGILALLTKAMQAPGNFDSGLYHFASIRWANEYAVVPGLGNLHGRLAFNQSIFDLYALLNFFPLWNKGYALGFLLIMLLTGVTVFEAHLERYAGGWWALLICSIALASTIGQLPSPTPDPIIGLLQISIFITLLGVLLEQDKNGPRASRHFAALLCLCALICTVKLSSIVFALLMLIIATLHAYRQQIIAKRVTLYCTILCAALIVSHVLHGIITSGVPFYPSSLGTGLGLDWQVLPEKIRNELNWVYSWARNPHQDPALVLGNWRWLKSWIIHLLPIAAWVYFGLSALFIGLYFFTKTGQTKLLTSRLQALYVPLGLSILFWFFTAPDWRFLGSIPQLFLAVTGWIFFSSQAKLPECINIKLSQPIFWLAPALLLACVKLFPLNLMGWQAIPQAALEKKMTRSGLSVWVPENGQTQCWDGPLPCTPYFNEDLIGRDFPSSALPTSPSLQKGFIDRQSTP